MVSSILFHKIGVDSLRLLHQATANVITILITIAAALGRIRPYWAIGSRVGTRVVLTQELALEALGVAVSEVDGVDDRFADIVDLLLGQTGEFLLEP